MSSGSHAVFPECSSVTISPHVEPSHILASKSYSEAHDAAVEKVMPAKSSTRHWPSASPAQGSAISYLGFVS